MEFPPVKSSALKHFTLECICFGHMMNVTVSRCDVMCTVHEHELCEYVCILVGGNQNT